MQFADISDDFRQSTIMSTDAKRDADAGTDTSFNIQVSTNDGRLLGEFTLSLYGDDVRTLGAVERIACKNRSDNHGEPLAIVVSEETSTKLRQVQPKVAAKEPTTHQATHDDA